MATNCDDCSHPKANHLKGGGCVDCACMVGANALDVSFFVALLPHAQQRPRAMVIPGKEGEKPRADVYKAREDREHEASFAALAEPARPRSDDGKPAVIVVPVVLDVLIVQPRPASLSQLSKRSGHPLKPPGRRWSASRPDLDNLLKTALDSMKGWWADDAQVVGARAFKVVARLGESPGYHIRVRHASAWSHLVKTED